MKTNNKFLSVFTAVVFLLILSVLAVAFLIKPADASSEEENRKLQQFPDLTTDTLLNGSFTSDMNTYLNDQFPFRDFFVGVKSLVEIAEGKRENNGVLLGENGQLAVRDFKIASKKDYTTAVDFFDSEVVSAGTSALQQLQKACDEAGVQLSVLLPPRTLDIARSAFSYPSEQSDLLLEQLRTELTGVHYLDIAEQLRQKYDAGEYVMYRTDHHWTSLGAYYAYCQVITSLGGTPYPISDFTVTQVSDAFYGTTYSKSGFKFIAPDCMDFYELPSYPASGFTTEIMTYDVATSSWVAKRTFDGFYDTAALATKSKYDAFIGGTNIYTRVTAKDGADRPTLVVIKDSFANSLVPFLALHYNLELVTLADLKDSAMLARFSFDSQNCLIVYNLENVISFDYLSKSANFINLFPND